MTGGKVGALAGERLIRCTMELGGKAPVIVLPDAKLNDALNGVAFGAFVATGQTCISATRLIIHESIADDFVAQLKTKVELIHLGDPMDPALSR